MNPEVTNYYNDLASTYDESRFGNTYGKFIQGQEQLILEHSLADNDPNYTLDMGCGTGRFLGFAHYGIDISKEMIKVSKSKFSNKELFNESASTTHFDENTFLSIFSFHVFMHLDYTMVKNILNEAYRILKPGGKFIFDIPSKKRRRLTNYKPTGWHGANDFTIAEIKELINGKWDLSFSKGILFFPIHRSPKKIKQRLIKLDSILCQSFLKEYSSYLVLELKKR